MRIIFAISLLLASTAAVVPARTNIVSDPGFESAKVGVYTGAIGDGWAATTGSEEICAANAGDCPGESAHTGNQFAYLDYADTLNTLSQTLSTTPGQDYAISFWLADDTAHPIEVLFGTTVLLDGTAPTNGAASPADYVEFSYTALASSASTTLSFIGQYSPYTGNGTQLDDVSVTAISKVPEPSTAYAVLFGVGALLLMRRKQRKHAGR